MTLPVAEPTGVDGMISEQWIGRDMEGNGSSLIWDIIPTFAARDWKETTKNIRRRVCDSAQTRTSNLPNASQKYYSLNQLARSTFYGKGRSITEFIIIGHCTVSWAGAQSHTIL
jgi:hypothetical protein